MKYHMVVNSEALIVIVTKPVGSCDFTVVGPKTWNALLEDVTSSHSEYTFCCHLKTWLFNKSFSEHHCLILTASGQA